MPPTPSSAPPGFSRRTLLAVSATGLAVLVAGCSSSSDGEPNTVTSAQADKLTDQVAVQEALVAAYAAASKADAALGTAVAALATQASEQLKRLKAAAPGASAAPRSSAAPAGNVKAWLRQQVTQAATSHATACVDQTGARAALLGSIAAGLRGQATRLA